MPLKLLLIPLGTWVATKVVAVSVITVVPKYRKKAVGIIRKHREKRMGKADSSKDNS